MPWASWHPLDDPSSSLAPALCDRGRVTNWWRLARRLGAPLATSLLAKDLFAGEPEDLGVCGSVSHDIAIETIAAADCLVVFGASLNDYTAAHGDLLRGKAVIHCDLAAQAIGRYFAVDAALVGDAGKTARAILEMLDAAEIAPTSRGVTDVVRAPSGPRPAQPTSSPIRDPEWSTCAVR